MAWVTADRGFIRPNLYAVCEPCAVRHGHLTKDAGWVAGTFDTPRQVLDPQEALAVRAELVTDAQVEGHRLLLPDHASNAPGTNALKLERRVEALRLRQAGADYRTILAELRNMGFDCSIRQVYDDVQEALTELTKMEHVLAEEILELELSRLDIMYMALAADIQRGDVFAIQTALKIMERRSRYLGLDKPTKVEATGNGAPRPLSSLTDAEVRQRTEQLMARLSSNVNGHQVQADVESEVVEGTMPRVLLAQGPDAMAVAGEGACPASLTEAQG